MGSEMCIRDRVHTAGKNLTVADLLLRKPVSQATAEDEILAKDLTYASINSVTSLPASTSKLMLVREAQTADVIGKQLRDFILNGWPKSRAETPERLIPYRHHQSALHVANDLILFRDRLWIPSKLRQELLEKLHASHFGVTKTCALARTSIWWPNLDSDVEKLIADCLLCAETRTNRSEPLIPTPLPERPWAKLGLDLLKEGGKWFLVVIDYYSKYLEFAHLPKLDSKTVVSRLATIFARFGVPDEVYTDNGTQLVSEEMKVFAHAYDFKLTTRSPAYPQSNGLAEAAVKIAKKILRTPEPSIALLHYRATPTTTGYSPAQLLFGRNIKTTLPSVNLKWRPWTHSQVKARDTLRQSHMERNFNRAKGARPLSTLQPGRKVFVEDTEKHGEIVYKREEPRSYDVRFEDGSILRRNRKSLHPLPVSVKAEPLATPQRTTDTSPQDSLNSTSPTSNSRGSPTTPSSVACSPTLLNTRKSLPAPCSPDLGRSKVFVGRRQLRSITQPRTGSSRYNLRSSVRS